MKNVLTALLENYFKQNQVKNLKCMNDDEYFEFCKMFAVCCADNLICEIDKITIDEMYKIQEKVMYDNGWVVAKTNQMIQQESEIEDTDKTGCQKEKTCKCQCKSKEKTKKNLRQKTKTSKVGGKPSVLTMTEEHCKKTSNRGRARKIVDTKLYADISKVPCTPGSEIVAVYLRKNGARTNVYYGVVDSKAKQNVARNELRTVYARALGVNYLNVSTYKASNEAKLKNRTLKKDAVQY